MAQARQQISSRDSALTAGQDGFYLQFDIPLEHREAIDGLESRRSGIEIVAVRPPAQDAESVSATVFVPLEQADFFETKVEQYRSEETRTGNPRNQNLVARIDDVRLAPVRALFTDAPASFPARQASPIWWEIWIRDEKLATFRAAAARLNVRVKDEVANFPERDVVLALADRGTMERLVANSDAVAELRIAKDTPSFFLELAPSEQADWVLDARGRVVPPGPRAPAVCLLDSGANRAHPLLQAALDPSDQHSYDPTWGVGDSAYWNGHGTMMCGVALYGDLEAALAGPQPLRLRHRLETVKILPPASDNDPKLYAAVTEIGVSRVETHDPRRRRVFAMAITSEVGVSHGRPSAWAGAIDQLAYGGGDRRRLMVLAAGNLRGDLLASGYLDENDLAEAENPCQAWNALVAGAYTDKITVTHPDYLDHEPMAPPGDLSPSSRTSTLWERQWPIRPDVVFEGGNLAHDGVNPGERIADLQLVSTYYRPNMRLLDSFGDTSAAAALGAHLCATIIAERPDLWPETIRGLVVHAAEWTPAMWERFDEARTVPTKIALLRRYGWGVPETGRALRSAQNDATLMIEDALLPFRRENSTLRSGDMNLHRLPWPRRELLSLGDEDVELRVTLSYFVEPNPGERGWTRRHRYASHGLRFAVKRPLESERAFVRRINQAARESEDSLGGSGGSDGWLLGSNVRDRGSVHSDIWRGSAAELAERGAVGVYPVGGWWKEKPALQRWDRSARYALIMSIRAPETEVDLYTPMSVALGVEVPAS